MDKMFISFQGTEKLKDGKQFVQKIKNSMKDLIPLPEDVIEYFVKCRLFFRMRILNRKIMEDHGEKKYSEKDG